MHVVMCVYIPKIHDDERRPTASTDIQKLQIRWYENYSKHRRHTKRHTTHTSNTRWKENYREHIQKRHKYDGTRTIASTDLQKDTKYDGTRTIESSDIQKTPNTHTKYMIEGKRQRVHTQKTPNTMEREL